MNTAIPKFSLKLVAAFAALAACATYASAPPVAANAPAVATTSADDAAIAQLRAKLAGALAASIDEIRPAPMPGWYEIRHGHLFAYASADGKYLMKGDLFNVENGERITETRRRADRLAALALLPAKDFIEFAAPPPMNTKYTVTVFTDVDCGYCRKMHSQIDQYNALGIAIRYVSFPRTGPGTVSWSRAEAVWCADDPRSALTRAKRDEPVKSRNCDNPVAQEYQLGLDLGLEGTPMLILPNGEQQAGYYAPKDLLAELEAIDAENAADKKAAAARASGGAP